LRSEATDGCRNCFLRDLSFPGGLQHGFVEQLFLAFGPGFAELSERFVELALDGGLVAEEELRFGDLGRVDEEIARAESGLASGLSSR
jgi:hypothetical protein